MYSTGSQSSRFFGSSRNAYEPTTAARDRETIREMEQLIIYVLRVVHDSLKKAKGYVTGGKLCFWGNFPIFVILVFLSGNFRIS